MVVALFKHRWALARGKRSGEVGGLSYKKSLPLHSGGGFSGSKKFKISLRFVKAEGPKTF
jgi:hypothetical protein